MDKKNKKKTVIKRKSDEPVESDKRVKMVHRAKAEDDKDKVEVVNQVVEVPVEQGQQIVHTGQLVEGNFEQPVFVNMKGEPVQIGPNTVILYEQSGISGTPSNYTFGGMWTMDSSGRIVMAETIYDVKGEPEDEGSTFVQSTTEVSNDNEDPLRAAAFAQNLVLDSTKTKKKQSKSKSKLIPMPKLIPKPILKPTPHLEDYVLQDGVVQPLDESAEWQVLDSGSEVDEEEEKLFEQVLQEVAEESEEEVLEASEEPADEVFTWSDDYTDFRGEQEVFVEECGPKIKETSPMGLFTQLWDQTLMESIVHETNQYAWDMLAAAHETEPGLPPQSRACAWVETSVSEMYRFIAVLISMSMCIRDRLDEYWSTGILSIPGFRKLMSKNRFMLLMRFLHFVDNRTLVSHGKERKLAKIKPLLDHLNAKFQAAYTPRRELSIDESLLLWKGHPSWIQCIRTKAARIGIKSYEICEAVSGYVLQMIIYTGKNKAPMAVKDAARFTSPIDKVVLHLAKEYLGKGYTIFMDNFYNSVALCRFLKSKKTDVVGTLNRRRTDTPPDIKNLNQSALARGAVVSRHCGDVSVLSWKDVRLVSTVSTYHKNNLVQCRRSGEVIMKPEVITAYNKFMGGVDLKDHKLSMYLMERKRGLKWYIKVFRRLLNISILNSYIMYTKNMGEKKKLTHRQYRYRLAAQLTQNFGKDVRIVEQTTSKLDVRLDSSLNHFPVNIPVAGERTKYDARFKRGCCARCRFTKDRKNSNVSCSACEVFLCVGRCWRDYHTLENLC